MQTNSLFHMLQKSCLRFDFFFKVIFFFYCKEEDDTQIPACLRWAATDSTEHKADPGHSQTEKPSSWWQTKHLSFA